MNPLVELQSLRQSFWLDYIRRSLITSGDLQRLIDQDGLRGMTSNPTIFEKAISSGDEYDDDLRKWASLGKPNEEIFENLAVKDIQGALDLFKPIYTESGGTDGFVSLEVNPNLAHDTVGTIAEAKRLVQKVRRPNLMIKVPGTPEGLVAIEELVTLGVNVNITLLFSVEVYKKVLDAYIRGLERRLKKGLPLHNNASVASFFVSRVDTIIDKMLDQKIAQGGPEASTASKLLHKAAIANAKIAYAHFEAVIQSPRWDKLKKKGAQVQRLLWASTSAKDKRLLDVIYVNELVGPDTVNTMPPQTVDAFREHGTIEPRLIQGLDQAQEDLYGLRQLGIDTEMTMLQLQNDGVRLFKESYAQLLHVVGSKVEKLTGAQMRRSVFDLGSYSAAVQQAASRMEKEEWVKRIWAKDAPLWKKDPEHQKIITNSLGWLTVVDEVKENGRLLAAIVEDVRRQKFTHALLLGMGGSSLCPEVLRLTFGRKPGFPDLAILDSTEPASVMERSSRSKPEKTLYIVASKSGSTTEPNAFLAYFYELVKKKKGSKAGDHFIAITDPGTAMEKLAKDKKFRHIVLNRPDIGGRYSALSYFGMLPAAIMGINVSELLSSASRMADACSPALAASKNPGASLGAALGTLANEGRNKVTFFLSKEIAAFSTWVEQLIAESTGKDQKGILPVESEPIQPPEFYGKDRVFVGIRIASDKDKSWLRKVDALKKAGHPVIWITLEKKTDIAAEFFRWEFATAVAGAFLSIDAFDQPNVQESKDLTKQFLERYKSEGHLSQESPLVESDGITVYGHNGFHPQSLEEALRNLLSEIRPGDYVALLAYLTRNPKHEAVLQAIRTAILASKKVATTIGFGPRFLHSTGQLHKGGANNGVFIQITADDKKDLPIPHEPYTYGILKEAQALGDLTALNNKGRRVLRIHLKDPDRDLVKLKDLFRKTLTN